MKFYLILQIYLLFNIFKTISYVQIRIREKKFGSWKIVQFFRIRIRNIPLSATGSTLLEYPILNGPLTSLSRKSHTVRCEIIFLGIEPYLFFYNIDCEALSNGHRHSFLLSEILNKIIKNSPCTSIKMYFTLYL